VKFSFKKLNDHVLSGQVYSIAQHINTVTSLRSAVLLYKSEQDVKLARHISVVAGNWIMAPKKRGVADGSIICKDNFSSTPFFTGTVGTARQRSISGMKIYIRRNYNKEHAEAWKIKSAT
jgi:hypothetical protein